MMNNHNSKNTLYTFAALYLVLIIDTMGIGLVFPLLGPLFLHTGTGLLSSHASIAARDFW